MQCVFQGLQNRLLHNEVQFAVALTMGETESQGKQNVLGLLFLHTSQLMFCCRVSHCSEQMVRQSLHGVCVCVCMCMCMCTFMCVCILLSGFD